MSYPLTNAEKQTLLQLARDAMQHGVMGQTLAPLNHSLLTPTLMENGASFVTLTIDTELRGCIGTLEAYQPLVEDVREHAIAAALQDPRFPPVNQSELSRIKLEISRLTTPLLLNYSSSDELLKKIKPHVDGVTFKTGARRATFLPQVWSKIPDPVEFFERLCQKMGLHTNAWHTLPMQVFTYQVEEFHE